MCSFICICICARTVCHTPSNYNIVTDRQAVDEAWPPATISLLTFGLSHDIAIQKIPTVRALCGMWKSYHQISKVNTFFQQYNCNTKFRWNQLITFAVILLIDTNSPTQDQLHSPVQLSLAEMTTTNLFYGLYSRTAEVSWCRSDQSIFQYLSSLATNHCIFLISTELTKYQILVFTLYNLDTCFLYVLCMFMI